MGPRPCPQGAPAARVRGAGRARCRPAGLPADRHGGGAAAPAAAGHLRGSGGGRCPPAVQYSLGHWSTPKREGVVDREFGGMAKVLAWSRTPSQSAAGVGRISKVTPRQTMQVVPLGGSKNVKRRYGPAAPGAPQHVLEYTCPKLMEYQISKFKDDVRAIAVLALPPLLRFSAALQRSGGSEPCGTLHGRF